MRHEVSFLKDILSACGKIRAIVAATSEETFLKDEVSPAAVLHHLTVIGEAMSLQRQVLSILATEFSELNSP